MAQDDDRTTLNKGEFQEFVKQCIDIVQDACQKDMMDLPDQLLSLQAVMAGESRHEVLLWPHSPQHPLTAHIVPQLVILVLLSHLFRSAPLPSVAMQFKATKALFSLYCNTCMKLQSTMPTLLFSTSPQQLSFISEISSTTCMLVRSILLLYIRLYVRRSSRLVW